MPSTVILGTARTPVGRLGGSLASQTAVALGAVAARGALERAGVTPDQVEYVVAGTVLQAGQGQIPSRQVQIAAGIPREVPSETINKVCASGMRAVALVDAAVRLEQVETGLAVGMESMTRAPHLLPGARAGFPMGPATLEDAMVSDGLTNPFSGRQMFDEATEVGDELGLARADLDAWALRSHQRAIAAREDGRTAEELVPVAVASRKGDTVVDVDESPRRDTSLERLAALPGLTGPGGSHTAGNSPGVNDGAAAVMLASDAWAAAQGRTPLATVVAHGQSADAFAYLARTPAAAALHALSRAGLTPADVDVWEINEAFASVALQTVRTLELDEARVNVRGGAIALGHPVGASGARIIGVLVHELRRRGGGIGCAAICSGGGQGDAIVISA